MYAAGHDLYSAKDMVVPARGRALVGTDISVSVPVGTCKCFAYYFASSLGLHDADRNYAYNWTTRLAWSVLTIYPDGRVAPRSGLAHKHGIDTLAGVIDADYRGPVGVILANLSDKDFEIKIGDRIAQLIVEKIVMPEVVVVQKLEESVRGAGGFGSTGGFGVGGA